ncbi:LysR family transcriptional regulator [Xanthomonas campestris]|uniref:LysR family transcriptional regulator n=1 Tax=Xanthomonas TaxID=338 RepID=UPI001E2C67C9|nr:LysR family transcriptional regulator [Xanthomonas campestris]MCC5074385.1 LysR family transcriptional regulator [Xanthomonas campestris pv. plantaginis]MCC5091193.1 LysR family transcriptional regulator [Xanthomonas campestris]MEA9608880.1 LysR family transcriptional regulator [Xanthomonas campestris pv. plantaginis]
MLRESFSGMVAFIVVARERSFTRAAAHLGLSQSAVSHAVRALEKSLGVQLLVRSSRLVAPTEAGEHLITTIAPRFEEIDAEIMALSELRDSPTGTIRITASDHSIRSVLSPKLKRFLPKYPGIKIELFGDNGLVDIAADRFDAGVRLGEAVAQDMIAVRIGPDIRFAAVATKAYFKAHPAPKKPEDLIHHNCINLRLPTHGGIWPWEFEKAGREVNVRVDGQLTYNSIYDCLEAACSGLGIAYVPDDIAAPHIAAKQLIHVMKDWSPPWPGLHMYYPSRRQPSGAMALLIAALRYEP